MYVSVSVDDSMRLTVLEICATGYAASVLLSSIFEITEPLLFEGGDWHTNREFRGGVAFVDWACYG